MSSTTSTTPQFFIIPLTPGTPQTLRVQLVNTEYEFALQYCNAASLGWVLTISDQTGNQLASMPVLPGFDLLEQYQYLGIGGALFVLNQAQPNTPPTFAGLGSDWQLYFAPYP